MGECQGWLDLESIRVSQGDQEGEGERERGRKEMERRERCKRHGCKNFIWLVLSDDLTYIELEEKKGQSYTEGK
jgi:hypothetical protein